MGLDNAIVSSEFERLVQAFVAGAAESAPSMPLTAVVVQVRFISSWCSLKLDEMRCHLVIWSQEKNFTAYLLSTIQHLG